MVATPAAYHVHAPVAGWEGIVPRPLMRLTVNRNAILMAQGQTPPSRGPVAIHLGVIFAAGHNAGTSLSRRYWSVKWDFGLPGADAAYDALDEVRQGLFLTRDLPRRKLNSHINNV